MWPHHLTVLAEESLVAVVATVGSGVATRLAELRTSGLARSTAAACRSLVESRHTEEEDGASEKRASPIRPSLSEPRSSSIVVGLHTRFAIAKGFVLSPIMQTLPSKFRQSGLGRCQPTDSLTHSVRGLLQFCRLILHHAQHSLHASSCDSGLHYAFWARHSCKEVILFISRCRAAPILCLASLATGPGKSVIIAWKNPY